MTIRPLRCDEIASLVHLCGEHTDYEKADYAPEGKSEPLRRAMTIGECGGTCHSVDRVYKALDALVSVGKPVICNQVLPNRFGVTPATQVPIRSSPGTTSL
jgi:hypothetical protein